MAVPKADILILDEPTAVLTPQEINELMIIMQRLVKDGKTIIIITHKLKEILASSDYCTIIRRGKWINTVALINIDENQLADMMVGHAVKLKVEKTPAVPKEEVFTMENVNAKDARGIPALKDMNLRLRKGEIYGLAGIDGNGQKELIEVITNLRKADSGKITMNGEEIQNTTTRNTMNHKISTIHEDREKRGLIPDFTVEENVILDTYMKEPYSKNGILKSKPIEQETKELIKEYDIRPDDCEKNLIRGLSGGNQQKVIIAREIANDPDLLIAVQPTRGLDVGAIETVHNMLIKERDKGKAVLLVSLELDEVMSVSDRIGVIYDGHIQGEFKQGEVDEQTIGLLMAGGSLS